MKRSNMSRSLAAIALAVCQLSSSPAEAKKPDNPGGGGGGNDGGNKPAITYRIVKLDTSDGNGAILPGSARDLNDSRLIVGSVIHPIADGELWKAACWSVTEESGNTASTLTLLDDTGFGNLVTSARGCNKLGEIVGGAGDVNAVYWSGSNGTLEPLPGPDELSEAAAINDQGVVCGWSGPLGQFQAAAWYFVNGQWTHLALPHLGDPEQDDEGQPLPNRSFANAISNADSLGGVITIVGWSNGNAALWTVEFDSGGNLVVGPAMILDPGAEASGLNNTGIVCGFGHLGPSSGGDGVVWVDAGPAELLTPTYSKFSGNPQQVFPVDVNDSGLIVGDNFFRALVWPNVDSAPILLDDFLVKGKKANFSSLSRACAVNKWNEVVGYGSHESIGLPFLAVPVPE